jgi:hypothetical protein
MAEPTITTTVNAATPMILSHLDPIIFMASPIAHWSKKFNPSYRGSTGRDSPKPTAFLYPSTLGRPALNGYPVKCTAVRYLCCRLG